MSETSKKIMIGGIALQSVAIVLCPGPHWYIAAFGIGLQIYAVIRL
jgi:hypothetical protein